MSFVKNDLVGKKFGKLTVVKSAGENKTKTGKTYVYWSCLCDCGTEVILVGYKLKQGRSNCCGCNSNKGYSKHPVYSIYNAMRSRCYNTSNADYYNYGSRGIKVCDRWLEPRGVGFMNFLSDMGEKQDGDELDRICPDKDYEPSNCRWVKESLQAFNKRISKTNTSGRTGVQWSKQKNKWEVSIGFNSKRIYLGVAETFEDACRIRDSAEIEYYGFLKE